MNILSMQVWDIRVRDAGSGSILYISQRYPNRQLHKCIGLSAWKCHLFQYISDHQQAIIMYGYMLWKWLSGGSWISDDHAHYHLTRYCFSLASTFHDVSPISHDQDSNTYLYMNHLEYSQLARPRITMSANLTLVATNWDCWLKL